MGWSIHHPVGLIHYTPAACQRGYTLFSTTRGGHDAYLIDMRGNVVHRWHSGEGIHYAYLLDNGNLLCRTMPPQDAGGIETVGGSSASIIELDWDSNLVWAYRDNALHHDYERLPNGNTLALLWEPLPNGLPDQVQGGYDVDFAPGMLGDVVREITPDGATVWEWRSWEHLDLSEDIISHMEPRREWTHQNCLNVTPDGDLLVSFRLTSTVGIVDRASGAFKWKWGPGELYQQHHPTWLDSGRVLIFDNGSHRRGASHSRIVEVDPETNEIHWQYLGAPPISFYSYNISSAERQPNGNTLICEGAPGRMFEVTPRGEIVWEYINPFFMYSNAAGGGAGMEYTNATFRCHRYGPDHPALAGRDLDPARHAGLNRLLA
ncbi:MAG: aryl-sulfate sulfotransferase [Chloroflexota bacterium]|nr:aryl-sulfate sulfotransferase [Chloroflexota bacterium]MDE2685846.1 aryl-sulfate sulfotransferase [Chloroflexota bacterium]